VRVVELSGGVGGARLGLGIEQIPDLESTIVVNVGDDDDIHGLAVSADLDTVVYTLAGLAGPQGWGRDGDSFITNDEMGRLGADNRFQLGDLDLAMNILRTEALRNGVSLSVFTADMARRLGIRSSIIPATDQKVSTLVTTEEAGVISFQEYFVLRNHRDTVTALEYRGAGDAKPVPGSLEAITDSDIVLIAPSNPPLSIWPILAIPGYREVLANHDRVVAVSPLFGGKALKGPANRVMNSLGLPPGNRGVATAYDGLLDVLIVDVDDEAGADMDGVTVVALDTRIPDVPSAARLVGEILGL
jgi:LPPG:FO 2-phospho-L-lactate transferase